VEDRSVVLLDIRAPIFVVSAERDHVAPWRSVFKFHVFSDTEITFVLTSGGHNAGIVSEPGHPHRHFRVGTRETGASYIDPDGWFAEHVPRNGSWWPAWSAWLAVRSGAMVEPPSLGDGAAGFPALEDAPGHYVFMK